MSVRLIPNVFPHATALTCVHIRFYLPLVRRLLLISTVVDVLTAMDEVTSSVERQIPAAHTGHIQSDLSEA